MKKGHGASSSRKKTEHTRRTAQRPREDQPGPAALAALFQDCGLILTERQIEQFWLYHGLLRHHNTALNLTRIHNFNQMVLKLYVDSVLPGRMTDLPSPLMDLGSGPGMPGIPLKIMHPQVQMVLAEGRAKRAAFLLEAVAQLGLDATTVVDRNITPAFEQPVAGVITRAVEVIADTLARVQGCLAQGGRVILMKGPGCDPEIAVAQQRFDGRFALVADTAYRIGGTSNERRLVVFERLDAPRHAVAAQAAGRHRVTALTSDQNSRFKALKKMLTGRGIKKGAMVLVAGARPVHEAMAALPQRCRAWITRDTQDPPPEGAPSHMEWLQLAEPLYQTLDIFGTRAPLLCLEAPAITPWSPAEGFPLGCSLLVPFQDPENIGAVIRSAAAFGVRQVILLGESAHPFHPKALRASAGAALRLPLRQGPFLADLPPDLPLVALSAEGTDIAAAAFPPAFGLLAGLEGQGLPAVWRSKAVRIPLSPVVESLNAATSAAVALYEWQRRQGTLGDGTFDRP
ncbi:RsmG family class I SAM-dependent methyltransferase [Desulfatitalea alkaliphila]|uniref:Ribosomal RNA small subunit methyltransferase G n=1 Tax=Desulfatitalea alkaliphila TaxID=2929485 RepID=A0AA41UN82_9BACT|nr:RsmG family class I SAM-dependent methyltransferase [Desulfatitalea alkaliphila]MCJ8499273.1 class I SAM-dependent methyltransferase [Desulfatitalea alkaliphila]